MIILKILNCSPYFIQFVHTSYNSYIGFRFSIQAGCSLTNTYRYYLIRYKFITELQNSSVNWLVSMIQLQIMFLIRGVRVMTLQDFIGVIMTLPMFSTLLYYHFYGLYYYLIVGILSFPNLTEIKNTL